MRADEEELSREWEWDRQGTQVCLYVCQYSFIVNTHALWNCVVMSANICLSMYLSKSAATPIKSPPSSLSPFSQKQYQLSTMNRKCWKIPAIALVCLLPEIRATSRICKFSYHCFFFLHKTTGFISCHLEQTSDVPENSETFSRRYDWTLAPLQD